MSKADLSNILVEKTLFNGFGLAYGDNRTIFVGGAIQGDIVDLKIYKKKKDIICKNSNVYSTV